MSDWAERFLNTFERWAKTRGDILGAAIVGSFARGEETPASDIDLVVLTTTPADYLMCTEWASTFGVVQSEKQEDWGAIRSLRIRYIGGREVEYGFTLPAWASMPPDDGTRAVARRGIRVLVDPLGMLAALCHEVALAPGSD